MGLTLEDVEVQEVEIYPENWQPLCLFLALQTQWRVGPGGPTGLDYAALPVVERRLGVKRADRNDVFNALQVLERTVLAGWAER